MKCAYSDANTERIQIFLHRFSNLASELFLHLQAPREALYKSWNLGQADNLTVLWKIPNSCDPRKWHHVVFAHRRKLNPANYNHFVVVTIEHCA